MRRYLHCAEFCTLAWEFNLEYVHMCNLIMINLLGIMRRRFAALGAAFVGERLHFAVAEYLKIHFK